METYKKIIAKNGKEHQFRQLQEECAELITAVSHYFRKDRQEDKENLLEELADVSIMLEQLPYLLDDEDLKTIDVIKQEKIARLERLCEAESKSYFLNCPFSGMGIISEERAKEIIEKSERKDHERNA